MAFRKIKIVSLSGNQQVTGDVILETVSDWQIAVDGKVNAYSKKEFQEIPLLGGGGTQNNLNDVFGAMFGKGFPGSTR